MGKWQKIQEAITASTESLDSHPGNVHNAIANSSEKNPIHSKFLHNDFPYNFTVNMNDLHKHLGLQPKHVSDYIKKYNKSSEKSGWIDGAFSHDVINGRHEVSFDHGG